MTGQPEPSPLERAVRQGDLQALLTRLPEASHHETGEAFLLALAHSREDFALLILEHEHGEISPELVGEALRDASAHHETNLLARLLKEYRGQIPPEALLDALHIAIEGGYEDILDVLMQEDELIAIINTDSDQYPHPIISAILAGSEWVLEKLLAFPKLEVEPHHIAFAEQHQQKELAQRLKLQLAVEQFRELDQRINLIQAERYQGVVGPYSRIEQERRKRQARMELRR